MLHRQDRNPAPPVDGVGLLVLVVAVALHGDDAAAGARGGRGLGLRPEQGPSVRGERAGGAVGPVLERLALMLLLVVDEVREWLPVLPAPGNPVAVRCQLGGGHGEQCYGVCTQLHTLVPRKKEKRGKSHFVQFSPLPVHRVTVAMIGGRGRGGGGRYTLRTHEKKMKSGAGFDKSSFLAKFKVSWI